MSLHDMLLKAIQEGDTREFGTLIYRLKKRSEKNKANSLQYISCITYPLTYQRILILTCCSS